MGLFARLRRWRWRIRGAVWLAPNACRLAAAWLLVYVIQQVVAQVEFVYGYSFGHAVTACFGLNGALVLRGFFWQPVTYAFLHANALHLGLNMLTTLLFGSALESEVGPKRFLRIFFLGCVLGGLGWLAVIAGMPLLSAWAANLPGNLSALARWTQPSSEIGQTFETALCLGASGGIFALIGAYAALFPHRTVYVLLLFFPVRVRARTLAGLLGAITVAEAVLIRSQIASAAHLAGGLAGFFYGWRLNAQSATRTDSEQEEEACRENGWM